MNTVMSSASLATAARLFGRRFSSSLRSTVGRRRAERACACGFAEESRRLATKRFVALLLASSFLAQAAMAQDVSEATLRGIKVTSGRTHAVVGFNNNEVQLWLPRIDNSAYSTSEFSAPQLVDASGNPVAYKLEQGIYDHKVWANEIRFKTEAEPARMIGTILLRYPVRIRSAATSDSPDMVTKPEAFVELPDVVVEQWQDVRIAYDLPIASPLQEDEIGQGSPRPEVIPDTPGGSVTLQLVSSSEKRRAAALKVLESRRVSPNVDTLTSEAAQLHVETVEALLDSGIDVDARNTHGLTAFQSALFGCSRSSDAAIRVLRLLASRGADLEGTDANGNTHMMRAVQACNVPVVATLIELGANANPRQNRIGPGFTPLIMAITLNKVEVAELLVKHGARLHKGAVLKPEPQDPRMKKLVLRLREI